MPDCRLPRRRADRLAARLQLDVDRAPVCLACLSIVAFGPPGQSSRTLQGRLVRTTRDLWDEGLEEYAIDQVTAAVLRGVPDSESALADLEEAGGRSPIARAIVLRLAKQLERRAGVSHRVIAFARRRLDATEAELN